MAKLIDNYIIVQTIHSSQGIQKHKGRNLLTKQSVFIKTISIQKFYAQASLKEQILNEINILKKINTESLVKMIKMLKSSNNVYLIYQNVLGIGLDNVNKEFRIQQLIDMVFQCWKNMLKNNVVHGNLKPTSLIVENRKIKIKGFYCAKLGNTINKFHFPLVYIYSAPQIFQGFSNSKSDMFSIGLILYEIIYGKLPYDKSITQNQLRQFWKSTKKIEVRRIKGLNQKNKKLLEMMLEVSNVLRPDWQILFKQNESTPINNIMSQIKNQQSIPKQYKNESIQEITSYRNRKNFNINKILEVYGQKRNKLSIIVAVIKLLVKLDNQSLLRQGLRVLKHFSNDLNKFVNKPSGQLKWVDAQLQNQWRNTSYYSSLLTNEFQNLQITTQQFTSVGELINQLQHLAQVQLDKCSITLAISLLEDLQKIQMSKLTINPAVDYAKFKVQNSL